MISFSLKRHAGKNDLPAPGNENAVNTYLLLIAKVLALSGILKCIFYIAYKRTMPQVAPGDLTSFFQMGWMSLAIDIIMVCLLQAPLMIGILLPERFAWRKPVLTGLAILTALADTAMLILAAIDIVYFRFHRQRADEDLLDAGLNLPGSWPLSYIILLLIGVCAAVFIFYLLLRHMERMITGKYSRKGKMTTAFMSLIIPLVIIAAQPARMLPNYPLVTVNAEQTLVVQNSLHNFLYSIYRGNNVNLPDMSYLPDSTARSIFTNERLDTSGIKPRKNIILFIMESVPGEFFSRTNRQYIPFMDSLVEKSTYFDHAYAFAHHSNKGITAILCGMPTLTEIPFYHSKYTTIPFTGMGTALSSMGYQRMFFIGDRRDNFGFEKCANLAGIDQYFSEEQMTDMNTLPQHTMGMQDEYSLAWMASKLHGEHPPFLAVHYNISTHYPYDIPADAPENNLGNQLPAPVKSMAYYSRCLGNFFTRIMHEPWYSNTMFIFCSDHWMYPGAMNAYADPTRVFQIPIIIFDPSSPVKKIRSNPVSQLDVLNTVLSIGDYRQKFTGYGENLLAPVPDKNRIIVCRETSYLYYAYSKDYMLGFDVNRNRATIFQPLHKGKISTQSKENPSERQRMLDYVRAFLQTAARHYHSLP